MTLAKTQELFGACGRDFAALKAAAARQDFRPSRSVVGPGSRWPTHFARSDRTMSSPNSKGWTRVENEYIVYTAHWDHLGRDPESKGDSIYNGAADNASGVAAVLEIARAHRSARAEAINPLPHRDRRGEGAPRASTMPRIRSIPSNARWPTSTST